MRKFFGDSIKGTAEFSYISIGIGMALGFLLGAIQFPLPGIGKLAIGLSGVLIMALVLGNLRRTRGMNWTIPLSANLVIRNLGLTLFLAQVGMASGPKFAATVTETGFLMLGFGRGRAARARAAHPDPRPVRVPHAVRRGRGHRRRRVRQPGDPRLLEQAHADRPAGHRYAMIFPGMTIVKILFVDIVPRFLGWGIGRWQLTNGLRPRPPRDAGWIEGTHPTGCNDGLVCFVRNPFNHRADRHPNHTGNTRPGSGARRRKMSRNPPPRSRLS